MARPSRIEFPHALYHVTSRGKGGVDIYWLQDDRALFLEVLEGVVRRFNWKVHGYCLMGNHYHLLLETPDSNLSHGMRQLNGVYSHKFNLKYERSGSIFNGRYKAVLVEKERYLLELARYIVVSPVKAGIAKSPGAWPWSSYQATAGMIEPPDWLYADWILSAFSDDKMEAAAQYRRYVERGKDLPSPWIQIRNQIYLGSDQFIDTVKCTSSSETEPQAAHFPQPRQTAKPIDYYARNFSPRNVAIKKAYLSGAYSMKTIGDYFGLHTSRISRILKQMGEATRKNVNQPELKSPGRENMRKSAS